MELFTKRILLASSCLGAVLISATPLVTLAQPQGGVVTAGSASIDAVGNTVNVQQNSHKAVIDWRGFDIGAGEQVQFHQPSSNAIALNRVHSNAPTQIDGSLKANGNLMIVNQNGVLFGRGANVDVNGLIASTADIDTNQFMNNKSLVFDKAGKPDAAIINNGHITAKQAGLVGFVAPSVINNGVIKANLGRVHLASGDQATIDMYGDGLMQVSVSDNITSQLVANGGIIEAKGGTIALTAAAGKHIIDSMITGNGTLNAQNVDMKEGKIIISSAHNVDIAGTLDASSSAAKGGNVIVTADTVNIKQGAHIIVDGKTNGGKAFIGGDYLGGKSTKHFADAPIATAKKVQIAKGSRITANATDIGDGGTAIVWSDNYTSFAGEIEAKGGVKGGNGGFVETSSHEVLQSVGTVNASAPQGKGGTWLLDPNNITIQNGASGANSNVSASPNFISNNDSAIVTSGSIQNALDSGTDVIVQTSTAAPNSQNGDITVATGTTISKTNGTAATLTLKAHNDINFQSGSSITSSSDRLNIILNSDSDASGAGAISMVNATLATNGGNIVIGGGLDPTTGFAMGTSTNGNIEGAYISGGSISAGSGNITINAHGSNIAGADYQYGVNLTNGGNINTTSGAITINGVGGNGTNYNEGIFIDGASSLITSASGVVTINGTGGNGTGTAHRGIFLYNGGQITSTGTATLNITGTGGGGGAGSHNNQGVRIQGINSRISTVDGAVIINGVGATGTRDNDGFIIVDNAQVISTGNGTLNVTGTAGNGTISDDGGIYMGNNSIITSANGAITINGTGGNGTGTNNLGLYMQNGSQINSTGTATLNITGTGGNGADYNDGIFITDANSRISTVNGAVTINGNGGSSNINSQGILLWDTAQITSTGTGILNITGTGGNGTGSGNRGTVLQNGSQITSTGTATMNITGNGGSGTDYNDGIYLENNSLINSLNGAVTMNGTGGNGTGTSNRGTVLHLGSQIISTGTATLNITGTGGNGTDYNQGIELYGANSKITSANGAVIVNGTGGTGTSGSNHGIIFYDGGQITSTGAATLNITGTGGL
jgi:filamentous hemagglutinin family protein